MEGLVEEGSEIIEEDFEDSVKDADPVGASQRVEHHEIAAYGTVKTFADTVGQIEHVSLLAETLGEEKETDAKLTDLAKKINVQAGKAAQGESAGFEKKEKRLAWFLSESAWKRPVLGSGLISRVMCHQPEGQYRVR